MHFSLEQVALKWRFDWAGPPHGLVERLITSCRVLGEVEKGLCWRYGAVFRSHAMTSGDGEFEHAMFSNNAIGICMFNVPDGRLK